MESSLQGISSRSLLWKRNKLLVVIQTWSWCGKAAASSVAWLREASAERYHFIFPCYMFLISKCKGKSDLGLCMSSVFAKKMPLCRLLIQKRVWPRDSSKVGTAQRHSLCKYRTHADGSVRSNFYLFLVQNMCTKKISWNFCFVNTNLVVKTNLADSICSEIRAWRVTGNKNQRKNKDNFERDWTCCGSNVWIDFERKQAFWRFALLCRCTAASALVHVHSPHLDTLRHD